ncbi:MAG: purine-nucleoside phosphorylase [Chlamydiales bacterium]|jgi:purine-nucleoside phosphorylase
MSKTKTYKDFINDVEASANWLRDKTKASPKLLIVLTGGLNGPEDCLTDKQVINSSEIPNFPVGKAKGHAGQLIFGRLDGEEVVLLKGRFHYYEGFEATDILFPYFVLQNLGVHSVVTVNAVGGIRNDLEAGDILLVTDHINLMGSNPLRGLSIHSENQFPDMSTPYDVEFQNIARKEAKNLGLEMKEGTLLANPGPSYETKAEIRMFRHFGADVVGMSTVFEVIGCNYLNIRVLTFSLVSNLATDRLDGQHDHENVLKAVQACAPKLGELIVRCARQITHPEPAELEEAVSV